MVDGCYTFQNLKAFRKRAVRDASNCPKSKTMVFKELPIDLASMIFNTFH